ncbi:hypothetical protein CHLRE_02g096737v5 [Chlamydomonas reinhardtii]|uniref:Uncharacterized protein n=1 Tax=Chlamydomonas reinhardtii TaxID=3055 RepID=A0A2K3E214_CHLRE|nr:uncharacterized protein CHLRE_02g096737v5 [Chlamydomonas reinhardtii]PNW86814.1 hypothetical protein CHLRE_02g096737v5 [Chlamydomonas reinhardtii]
MMLRGNQTLALDRVPEDACLMDQDTARGHLPRYEQRVDNAIAPPSAPSATAAQTAARLQALEEQFARMLRAIEGLTADVQRAREERSARESARRRWSCWC